MTVGQRIRERRIALDLSQRDLGNRLGLSRFTVSKVENSQNDNMTTDTLTKFAKALSCSEIDLMGLNDKSDILLRNFHKLSDSDKQIVLDLTQRLANNDNN